MSVALFAEAAHDKCMRSKAKQGRKPLPDKSRLKKLGSALKSLRNELGLTQSDMAQRLGVDVRTYQRYEKGEIAPDAIYTALEREFGVSELELKLKAGIYSETDITRILGKTSEEIKEYPPTPEVVEREYIAVPIITGVGAGGEVITDDYTLIKRSRLPKKSVSGFEVKGDSMEPTIPQGYIVLIDPNDTELREGKIYLFARSNGNTENSLILRRVHRVNNDWELVPDNRKYAPQKLITDEYRVIGRAVKKIPPVEPEDIE